jgi:hypothetical protein
MLSWQPTKEKKCKGKMGILAKQISLYQYQKVKKQRIEREIPKSFGLTAYPKGKN